MDYAIIAHSSLLLNDAFL